jgi:tape measure domain-containing protein
MALNMDAVLRIVAKVEGDNALQRLGAELSGIGQKAGATLSPFGQMKGALRGVADIAATIGVAAIGRDLLNAGIEAQAASVRINALAKSYGEVDAVTDVAARAAQQFALGNVEAQNAVTNLYGRLRPMGVSLKDIETVFFGVNKAAKQVGLSTYDTSEVLLQLSQALGSGKLQGDELRSIMERMPAVGQAVAKVMGVSASEIKKLGSEGKITTEVMIRAAAELNKIVPPPPTPMQEFQKALQDLRSELGENLLPILTPFVKGLTELVKVFVGLPEPIQTTVVALGALVLAAGPIASVITGIGNALMLLGSLKIGAVIAGWLGAVGPAVVAVKAVLGGLLTWVGSTLIPGLLAFFSGPVGWTVLAVAAVVAMAIAFREPLMKFVKWLWEWGAPIREFWIGLWEGAKEAAVTVWNGVKAVITGFFSWFAGFIFKAYVQPWITIGTALVDAAKSAWDAVKGTVSGFFDWVATGFRQNFLGPITDALNGIRQLFVTAFDAVKSFVSGWFTWWTSLAYQVLIEPFVVLGRQLPGVVQQAWDALSSLFTRYVVEPIKTGWNAAIAFVGSTASQIASLVQTAWQGISSFFQSNVAEPIKSVWQGLQEWMSDIVTRGAEALSRAYESIAASVRGAFQGVVNGIGGIINGVIGMINKLIAGVNSLRATVKLSAIPPIPLVTIPSFAVGGVVQRPTLAMVGEGGEREYIVPESKMAAASSRYLAGARGAAVIPTTANSGQTTSGGAVPMINISTGPVMEQQGERYVTLGDLESAVKQTATQIYATLRTPAGRRAIGVA